MIHEDEVKTDQTKAILQAVLFHSKWRVWWMATLMFVGLLPPWCPCVAVQLKSSCQATVMRNPHPSTTRDHLGIGCYFASLFHVWWLRAPSVCQFERQLNDRFPLRTWHITLMPGRPAGWEKTAAACHSSQPHHSLQRQTWWPWAPRKTCSLTSLPSVTQQREAEWMTDWGRKSTKCQADSDLMDRCENTV